MKNKLKISGFLAMIALFAWSCSSTVSENSDELTDLKSKRDSLKAELAMLNEKISEMDTTSTRVFTPVVTVEDVMIKDFVHKVEVQGTVETDENAMLNAEASGSIRKVHVEEGDEVREGQALITLDAAILSSQISEMETQLELANYMFEKQKKLMEQGVGTEIEFEQAKAQKNSLEKSIQTMRSQQGKTVVRAPFSGTIDEIMVSVGEMAAPGVPLLRIVNNDDVKITATLSENLLSSVNEGTHVDLVFPALNDTVIVTKVTSKGNFIDPVNRTFRIRMDLSKNKTLLPNMLAKVRVTDFKQDSAIVVNVTSIIQDTQNNNYIYKIGSKTDNGYTVEKVYVEVLRRYKGEASVRPLKGATLTAADRIVVAGAKGITEADIVTIQ